LLLLELYHRLFLLYAWHCATQKPGPSLAIFKTLKVGLPERVQETA
jgi:hypothetical protein